VNFEYPQYHGHIDWELLIVLNDQIVHKINGTENLLTVGTACLIGPKDNHALFYPNRQKNQFQGVTITARDTYVKELLALLSPTLYESLCSDATPLYFSLSPTTLEKYTNMLLNIQTYKNEGTPYTEQQCNIIFSSLLLTFLEQKQHEVSKMPSMLKDFVRQLNNPLITTEQIKAAQSKMPYSYPQLTRLFKKYMHCTITQYVNKTKLQYAKELLANTDMSLTEITNELHFESTSHFHSLFKKHFNTTPAEYRRLNRIPAQKE
jgi:AraC-like DNA-binding protein